MGPTRTTLTFLRQLFNIRPYYSLMTCTRTLYDTCSTHNVLQHEFLKVHILLLWNEVSVYYTDVYGEGCIYCRDFNIITDYVITLCWFLYQIKRKLSVPEWHVTVQSTGKIKEFMGVCWVCDLSQCAESFGLKLFIHIAVCLSHDKSKASSKASSPNSAI
jgi:hypothetical protein